MIRFLLLFGFISSLALGVSAQPCSPSGDETSYGTNNVWIGYVYNNRNFNNYRSYVNEGTFANPNFDQNFGGNDVHYATNGCSVRTETFSVRYKLRKSFPAGTYLFTVGGDDGFRLSLDGGSTWAINAWNDQPYTVETLSVALNGTYNLVLEYYENSGANRISFSVSLTCSATENTSIYGTGNIWNGYVYDGTGFNVYSGMVNEGVASSPDFDQSFGGTNVSYNTSACPVNTETFSIRYRLSKTFAAGTYMFTVGGDDGYRLSVDGGATWIIDEWALHSYTTRSHSLSLNGTYNLVLEYYENTGDNRVSFSLSTLSLLPVTLQSFTARENDSQIDLKWQLASSSEPGSFEIERSIDGNSFTRIGTVAASQPGTSSFQFTDRMPFKGMAYYRLKMTDPAGKFTYSEIVRVRLTVTATEKIKIYPTIVTGNSFFVVSQNNIRNAVITLSGVNGQVISKQNLGNLSAGQAVGVSAAAVKSGKGLYFVSLTGSDFDLTISKIIIQ